MITETDKAYAAGIIDGEGSVGVGFSKTKNSKTTSYKISVVVAMIDEDSILWLSNCFGGYVDMSNKTKTGNQIYRWTLHCRKAASFLEMVLPYLKLKKNRAEIAIKLASMARKRGAPKGHSGNIVLSEEELSKKRELALLIRAENQRSNPKISSYSKWGIN